MKTHHTYSDEEFEVKFNNLTFNPAYFSHEAHLRLAWIHIQNYGVEKAIINITHQIKQFAESQGDHEKYNHTITIAAIRAVYHFMLKSDFVDFETFIANNPRLKSNFKGLMNAHYSGNIFSNENAKKVYVEPDLIPFD